jgi:hypothetical protein
VSTEPTSGVTAPAVAVAAPAVTPLRATPPADHTTGAQFRDRMAAHQESVKWLAGAPTGAGFSVAAGAGIADIAGLEGYAPWAAFVTVLAVVASVQPYCVRFGFSSHRRYRCTKRRPVPLRPSARRSSTVDSSC